ncbi:MauE/DoxX family redox-associated membrane protein [Nonomuraea soli]|uniref:Putative membrane protein YphA (DoxX/SURF4 family) n=1 Tax=Nonomuraea soli TaxID=1032476 RepID=A0A7W0HNH5_9ACTN|nr:MauE/DoxX family redox-associated membrane protein [Nonomuraea soli]MBA2889778.1 putative membrane protein YphA (DoxX/SURF4 family) [Nonomuraea soli]
MAIPWVTTVARLILGVVLIAAGLPKFRDPIQSVTAVKAYQLLPESIATTVGHLLPIAEIILGILLVVGLLTRISAVLGGLLMLAFVFGIAWAWANGLKIDCGCFGGGGQLAAGQEPTYLLDIVRDFGLVVCAVWIALFAPGRLALDTKLGLGKSEREND